MDHYFGTAGKILVGSVSGNLPFHLTTVKPRDSEPEFFQVSLNRFLYKWKLAQIKAV